MAKQLSAEQKLAISRIGGLVVINAMIFQEILAGIDKRVIPLKKILSQPDPLDGFAQHWEFIYKEIDYYPIFHLSREILLGMTASAEIIKAINGLATTARRIINNRAALRHDLMGRIYHRLLVDAKYLGTYYTSIPSAALLLKLCLRPSVWNVQWNNIDEIKNLRIADLACGTGTLLMAAADAITDNYVTAKTGKGETVNISELQKAIAEDILYGYDVLPSALHLTASTLALRAPETTFKQMHLVTMPHGGPEHRLGSLEFLSSGRSTQYAMTDLFGAYTTHQEISSGSVEENVAISPVPQLDLCVMNPPFTRSVGGNLLFGSLPQEERAIMQKELKSAVSRVEKALGSKYANITAGLGSIFVLMANRYLRPGSRLGLVLPKALLSGVAWQETRRLLQQYYRVEFLIVSQDPERWNFSESTSLSEALLVAVKKEQGERETTENVIALNLWRNPTTSFEALAVAHELLGKNIPDVVNGQGALELYLGEQKVGEAIAYPWNNGLPGCLRRTEEWILPCAFGQADLIKAAYHLIQGNLWLPGYGKVGNYPVCKLEKLATLGPDRRDIHDGFALSQSPTAFPAFWGHNAQEVKTLSQSPNNYLSPLSSAKPGRNLRKVEDLAPLAGRLLIVERMRLNTQHAIAIRVDEKVLSNVWWTVRIKEDLPNIDKYEKALALWFNSTLGLLIFLANREETEGAWIDFKKPVLSRLPVLDLRALQPAQIDDLAAAFDNLSTRSLSPLLCMAQDEVRIEIDKAIVNALNLPDFSILQKLLGREPVVCLKRL